MDVHSVQTRSYNMSRIRSQDTKPELIVRRALHRAGLRYRLHVSRLPGTPDLVLPAHGTVIFVNGCFWHGHLRCRYFTLPKTRRSWWRRKISRTKEIDRENGRYLRREGWRVLVVWECELKPRKVNRTLTKLILAFR
jgi:DNA mismatch endonuclease, patch repair protein